MLEIKNLHVEVDGREILKGVDLKINAGEVHAIMGPNGSGKSTLCYAIMGHPRYKISKGEIIFEGHSIVQVPPHERAKLGLFLSFQHPSEIQGVKMFDFLKSSLAQLRGKSRIPVHTFQSELKQNLQMLNMEEEFAQRDVNDGFSGGEKKRNETLQMTMIKPKFAMLDEIDSGLDVDALRLVAGAIKSLSNGQRSFLLVTHYNRILEHIEPDFVHIMQDGKIVKSGGAELAHQISEKGYRAI